MTNSIQKEMVKEFESYTSNNTHQLDIDGMIDLLKRMGEIEE